jgi:acetoacetyl-CoA synthetase
MKLPVPLSGADPGRAMRSARRDQVLSRQIHLTVDALTAIWEEVLHRSPIFPEDNFFDLGGDSELAVTLFLEIEKAMGQSLPVAAIYNAPTVLTLAEELERVSPRFSPLVLLKNGDAEPPVFLVAGVGGSVVYFARLAKNLTVNHPVYAVEARGLDGTRPPDERVEDMATACLRTVQARQPNGPYLLVGHSLGGLVMLEVAQRLVGRGEEVALLAFLDTYPHPRYWRLSSWATGLMRNFGWHVSAAIRLGLPEALPYLCQRCGNLIDHVRVRSRIGKQHRGSAALVDLPKEMRRVADSGRAAWASYRPRFYPGTITYLKAEAPGGGGIWPTDPAAVWRSLARSLDIYPVPGNHRTMLAVHAKAAATQLSLAVERALAREQAARPSEPGRHS